ncbi:MAG: carbon-nitrogen hydrolase family protein [Parvularculaceae bacterium]|nr:carbon-nitrogen hydrolase family protein [Parvularculaceae bacterium]
MTEGSFRAAAVQMRSGVERSANLRDALALIEEAARNGARFVATPEMTNVLDRDANRLFRHLPPEDGLEEIGAFSDCAKRLGIHLLVGSMAVRTQDRRAANRSFLFGPDGAVIARYDKIHRFDVDLPNGETWRESNVYDRGNTAVIAKTSLAAFGLTICYDVRFPGLYRRLAQAGAEVLAVPAAFTKQTGIAHWRTLLTARAIETGSFVIAPAQGGRHEDGRETYGRSMIIGPWGDPLAENPSDEPGVVYAEIAPAKSGEARRRIPNLALETPVETIILGA